MRAWGTMTGRVARIVLFALVAAGCSSGSAPSPGNGHAAPRVEAEATSPTALDVRWEAGEDPHRWWVIVFAPDGRNIGQRTACGACRGVTVQHLAPASRYAVRVVAVDVDGSFGEFPDAVAASTPPSPGCIDAEEGDVCAEVDTTAPLGDATGVGLGGLHGITAATDREAIAALEPRAWRVAALDVDRFALARAHGAKVTVLLSDAWITTVGTQPPWQDWDRYEAFVAAVVDAYIASGDLPDYWDVQNEPAAAAFEGGRAITVELLLEQLRRAAAIIHERVPGAAVVGPSASYVAFGSTAADMDRVAQLAAGPGRALSGLSWHEIGGGCFGSCDGGPRAVLQHADDVRVAVANAGGPTPELHVNEWGAPWNNLQPGAIVGYLSSLALAHIDLANPTCWTLDDPAGDDESSCRVDPGTIGGLLLSDGRTPTDAWYAHRAYAQMTGAGFRLLPGTIADPEASLLATVSSSGVITVLLGRHTGCDSDVDAHCPAGVTYADARTVSLTVAAAPTSPPYATTVQRIESVTRASPGFEPVDTATVRPEGGRLRVGSWSLGDGDALVITLTPLAGADQAGP